MEEISYISYSSTVKNQRKSSGIKRLISFWLFLLPIMMLCCIFTTVAIVHLFVRNQIIKYSYSVPLENKKQKMLLDENNSLKSQLSLLISPYRIEKYAVEKLNMRYPTADDIIEISRGVSKDKGDYIGQTR
ncbi:MAG: cell division protein FtsL [Deltaproteobacteria bacterium]|nr:cell division protein FtsL [Deltaproteobacteria bacterium]